MALTLHEVLTLPPLTEGHEAYSHFYLPCLRSAAPSRGDYEVQVIRFQGRDMTDRDCALISEALLESFDAHGPERCSATTLREVGVSNNPAVTNSGIRDILTALLTIARFGKVDKDFVEFDADDDDVGLVVASGVERAQRSLRNPLALLHSLDLSNLSCVLSIENQHLAMDLVRAVPGLKCVLVPEEMESAATASAIEEGRIEPAMNEMFAAEERAEKERLAATEASAGFSYAPHASYSQLDFARNAELNSFPGSVKRVALAAGRCNARLRKGFLNSPLTPDDTERDFPKQFNLPQAALAISNALSYNNSLVLLDFSNNNVGDANTIILAEFLRTNRTLVELRLRSNQIGTKGGMALNAALLSAPNKTLLELDLTDNNVNDVVVNAFLTTVRSDVTALGAIHLEQNCITPKLITTVYQALMLNTQCREMKRLAPLLEANDSRSSKVALNSGDDHLDDISLKVLLHSLRNNTQVTTIDVSNNKITDEGAFLLAEMMTTVPSLRKVIAQFNNIGGEGARKMLKAIPQSKHIEKVDLKFQEPPLDDYLLQMLEKVAGLSNQPKCVRENGLGLSENDPDVFKLDLSFYDGHKRCDDETVSTLEVLLRHNTFVVDLNLSCNEGRVTPKSMPIVAALGVRLKVLQLNILGLNDDDILEPFCVMLRNPACALQTLSLEYNNLTTTVAQAFTEILKKDNDNVTALSLAGNRHVKAGDHEALQFYSDLNTHSKAFKSIVLSIEANTNKRLTAVDLCFVDKLNATGTSHGFRKEFGDLSAKLLCVAMAQNDTVKTVNMCGNRVTDVGAGYFARLLRSNVTLTHLDLSYNEITDNGLLEINKALRSNTTVKVFVFEGNKSQDPEVHKALQQSLQTNSLSVDTPYITAMNMTGKKPELGIDPRIQQFSIDKMVGSAILDDAMKDFNQQRKRSSPSPVTKSATDAEL